MSDRMRISRTWAQRFAEQKIAVPMLLRRAGLPPGLFQQEKVYVTTAELFALWRAVGEMTSDPAIGLRLGAETRFERSHPAAIAVMCSRTFADALERLGRYKKLTCPEEIRVHKKDEEAGVEFFYVEAAEPQPDVLVDMVLSWILTRTAEAPDINYTVEVSSDLFTWTSGPAEIVTLTDTATQLVVRDNTPVQDVMARFLRLRVSTQ